MSVDNNEEAVKSQQESFSLFGGLKLFVGVIVRPVRTFGELRDARYGYWVALFVIMLVVGLGKTVITQPLLTGVGEARIREDYERRREEQTNYLSSDDEEYHGEEHPSAPLLSLTERPLEEIIADFQAAAPKNFVFALIASAIAPLFGYLIGAGVIHVAGARFGGQATFGQNFRVAVWSTVPSVFRALTHSAVMLITGQLAAPGLTTLVDFVQMTEEQIPVYAFLANIDVFTLWSLVLLGIGVSQIAKLDREKSLLVSLIYFGVSVVPAVVSAFGLI